MTIDNIATVLETEERQLLEQLFIQDSTLIVIGTDAGEFAVGWDAFQAAMEQQFAEFDSTQITTREQRISFNTDYNAAWFSELMDWNVVAQGERVIINDTRVIGVLTQLENEWVIAQRHVSVPVAGQAAEY